MIRLACVVFGYIFGMLQTSYIIGKIKGVDIREHGSGNLGTTNSFRVFGKLPGIITLIMDVLKAVIAVIAGIYLLRLTGLYTDDTRLLYSFYIGVGAVLGHDFPFFLKFKGGKGVASTAGMILSIGHLPLFAIPASVFLILFLSTGYVSLGSITAYTAFAVCLVIFGCLGIYEATPFLLDGRFLTEIYCIGIFIAVLGIFKHRANIKRLLNGSENRFDIFKKRRK